MGKNNTETYMCEMCLEFKPADEVIDWAAPGCDPITVCNKCMPSIFVNGGSYGNKNKRHR